MITLPDLVTAKTADTTDKGLATFRASIRAAVRGLWSGQTDLFDFIDMMYSAIRRGYEQAWQEGAKECGLLPNERTEEETAVLDEAITFNQSFVVKYGDWVAANSKANGSKLQPALDRAELWVNRYNELKARAQVMACGDKKLKWNWSPQKEHCDDCRKLNGRVYRASLWSRYGISPQDNSLACGGWRCGCFFLVTDEPVTPGKPPALTGRR